MQDIKVLDDKMVEAEEGLVCSQCGKSDSIEARAYEGLFGDWVLYDCKRCDLEVHSELLPYVKRVD